MLYISFESSSRAKKYEIYQILNLKNVQFRRINFFFSNIGKTGRWPIKVTDIKPELADSGFEAGAADIFRVNKYRRIDLVDRPLLLN